MAKRVEVVIGTYEEYVVGYKVGLKNGKEELSLSFALKPHTSSVKCLATSGKYLASGAADDRIVIYDMQSRKEIQLLTQHEGTVNSLAFTPDGTHLLSGGDDGNLAAVRTNSWQVKIVWEKAHSGSAITCISCHPSGKIALSLGNDLTLRTWDLINGTLVYTTYLQKDDSLGKMSNGVSWSPDGNFFSLIGDRAVGIWRIRGASIIRKQTCDSKPTCMLWVSKTELVVGLEDGRIMLISTDSHKEPALHEAHQKRVKGIAYTNDVLATVSSSGYVTLWNLDFIENKFEKICSINTGCRPTCIALIDLLQFGDDYILTKEEEPQKEVRVKKSSNIPDQHTSHTGTVVVEYENEEEDEFAEQGENENEDPDLNQAEKENEAANEYEQENQEQSKEIAKAETKAKTKAKARVKAKDEDKDQQEVVAVGGDCKAARKIDGSTRSKEKRSSFGSWTETPITPIRTENETERVNKKKRKSSSPYELSTKKKNEKEKRKDNLESN